MFFKKIKKNNKGVDMAFVGTNYILVLIVILCAIVDFSVLSLCKISVVTMAKESALYALAHNFNFARWQEFQQVQDAFNSEDARATIGDYISKFEGGAATLHPIANSVSIGSNGSGGYDVSCFANMNNYSIVLVSPNIICQPNSIFKTVAPRWGGRIPFIGKGGLLTNEGQGVVSDAMVPSHASNPTIKTGVSCKIEIELG